MKAALTTISTAALLFLSSAQAADSQNNRERIILGYGASSCGTWIADRKENGWPSTVEEGWVLGFLSAYNVYGHKSGDISKNTDSKGLFLWIDNYCAQHPLDHIVDAAEALIDELPHQTR